MLFHRPPLRLLVAWTVWTLMSGWRPSSSSCLWCQALSSQSLPTPSRTTTTATTPHKPRTPWKDVLRTRFDPAVNVWRRTNLPETNCRVRSPTTTRRSPYAKDRDPLFDYTALSTDLPAPLNAVPAIQDLEACYTPPSTTTTTTTDSGYRCEHGWIDSVHPDGAKLHYRRFVPTSRDGAPMNPKGVVVWFHGLKGFGGSSMVLYDEDPHQPNQPTRVVTNMALVAETMVGHHGYAVYALDLYGHGYSEGVRHYVPDWRHHVTDGRTFVEHVRTLHPPPVPLFAAGESYGGCLALHVAHTLQQDPTSTAQLDSLLLLAPAIVSAKLPSPPVTFVLKHVLARIAPRWQPFFMPHPTSPARVYRDPRVQQIKVDRADLPYIGGSGTRLRLGTAVQVLEAMDRVYHDVIPHLRVPYCVVHGGQDHAVPTAGTDYLWQTTTTVPSVARRRSQPPEAFHNLLADPVREDVMDFLIQWTNDRVEVAAADRSGWNGWQTN